MSGHSKWHQIKRKKETVDAKRGQQFTKLANAIKQALHHGTNPATNPGLSEAINRAKQANMPQENIDRLLTKSDYAHLEQATYEAFGPHGAALIIETSTDNTKRTVAEIRNILKKHQGSLSDPGAVIWKFKQQAGTYTAHYPLTLDQAADEAIQKLLTELAEHNDVTNITTDVA